MKKNPFIKIITVIILWIAAFSLIFWSAIMLLWNTTEETERNQEINYSRAKEDIENNSIIEMENNDIEIINEETE